MNGTPLARAPSQQEPEAYEALIQKYGRLLWTVASGILSGVGSREDVEEVISDVFVELWQHPEGFDPGKSSIKTFLCVKTRSRAVDRLRQLRRVEADPLEEAQSPQDLLADLTAKATMAEIYRQLRAFPQPDGQILTLRLLYELKPSEIAGKLGLPVKQVYEKIRRGKARLADALQQEGYYE